MKKQHAAYLQGRNSLEVVNAARKKAGMRSIDQAGNQIVTNADAGHSNQNLEIAFDIGVFEGKHYIALYVKQTSFRASSFAVSHR
jgi:hypothetical protein